MENKINEMTSTGCRILTEEEVRERLNNTPKIDIEKLLSQGYVEAKEFHRRLENGNIQ